MSDRSKNRNKELENFLRYSQDQMSEEERNAFEKSLQQDPFDAEALEGLSSITPEEARADLAGLQARIQKRIVRQSQANLNTRAMWYRVAAAVTVLLVVTSVLFTLFNDRMGQLDRKVAESPEVEKEGTVSSTPAEKAQVEPFVETIPVQSKVEEAVAEAPERNETTLVKSEKSETEPEVESEIISEKIIEEELVREEIADIQIEKAEEEEAAKLAMEEDVHVDEVTATAPALAKERPAAAKSMKREMVAPLKVAGGVAADHHSISGVVISRDDKQPLPGVFIAVKGSKTGTVTDLEGRFQILTEDDSQNTLVTQFIGMESKEISIQDQDELLITLEPEVINLEEMVVIATAPQTVSQPTGYSAVLPEFDADQGKSDYRSAKPVGGKKEFNEYVKSNMQFPEQDDVPTRAFVVLNFVVGYDGRPAQVLVLKSPGKTFSDEAIRLLMEGPDWQPAEANGVKIEQAMRIRIVFTKD